MKPLTHVILLTLTFFGALIIGKMINSSSTTSSPVEDPAKWKVTELVIDKMIRAHLLTDPNGQTFLVVRDGNGTAMIRYSPIVK